MTQVSTDRAERSRAIPPSQLHEIHRLVMQYGGDAIALHVGEPHVRMPAPAVAAYQQALADGHTSYGDAPGLPALRESIAERLTWNGGPSPDRIFVTPGSCQAISAVLQSVATAAGTVLLPEIHWPVHLQQVRNAGMRPRFISQWLSAEELVAELEAAYDPDVCAIVVTSPANPSGLVLAPDVIAAAHGWAVRRRVWLISDEAYEDFIYAGAALATAQHDTALPEPDRVVFSVHTFSKGYSMTGCRLGFVAAPSAERAELLCRVQEATLVAPSTPVQFAGLAALTDRQHLRMHHDYVRRTREEVLARLAPTGLLHAAPAGGWYALLDLSRYTADSSAYCKSLLETAGVALAPGRGFLPPGHPLGAALVRITLCAERGATLEGIDRLLRLLDCQAAT
jgi:aspartate aminotransferase